MATFRERELGGEVLTSDEAKEYLWNTYRCALLAEMSPEDATEVLERKRRAHSNGQEALILLIGALPRSGPHQVLLDYPEREAMLGDVAAYLAWRYPWPIEDAAWFVLTRDPPYVAAVKLELRGDNTWTIEVHPWGHLRQRWTRLTVPYGRLGLGIATRRPTKP